jgi:predicted ATPase with chaperone activity
MRGAEGQSPPRLFRQGRLKGGTVIYFAPADLKNDAGPSICLDLVMAMAAAKRKVPLVLAPAAKASEAAVVEKLAVNSVSTLAEAVGIVRGSLIVEPTDSNTDEYFDHLHSDDVDFSDVRAQEFTKRALVAAASGGLREFMF